MKRTLAVALALGTALTTWAPVWGETGVSDKEILIGTCLSLEGPKAKFAKGMAMAAEEGAQTYVNYINAKGGVNGRKLKLVVEDDHNEPEAPVECFNKLMQDGVFMFGAGIGGGPSVKYIRLAEGNKVPAFGFHQNFDEIYDPVKHFVFGGGVPWSKSVEWSIDKLWDEAGKRKFAILYWNDVFGNTNLGYVQAAVQKHGGQLVAQESFPRNTNDVDAGMTKIAAAKPDVVILSCSPPSAMAALKKAKALGFKAIFMHTTGARGFDYPSVIGDAAEGFIFPANVPSPTESTEPAAKQFVEEFKKYYPTEKPEVVRFALYVYMKITAEALKRAGKDLTREGFVSAMESMKGFDVGLGDAYKVTFSATDHQAFDTVPFFIVHNGKVHELKNWKELK